MKDGIIKGTGNSRYLRGAGWPTSYEEFKAMAEAGTLPIDLNGINEAGWQQLATALNKANLLSDTTASKKSGIVTVNDFLSNCALIESGTYTGTGTSDSSNPNSLTLDFIPKILFISGRDNLNPYNLFFGIAIEPSGMSFVAPWNGFSQYDAPLFTSVSEKTVSWYSTRLVQCQLNVSGVVYHYKALG